MAEQPPIPESLVPGVGQSAEKEEKMKTDALMERISKMPLEEFTKFLSEELVDSPERHDLPDSAVRGILEKAFAIIEETTNTNLPFSNFPLLLELHSSIQLHGDFNSKLRQGDSIADRAFRALGPLAEKYPHASREFISIFGQDAQTVRPDVLVGGIADILWRPGITEHFKQTVLHSMNYLYAFYPELYEKAIIAALDFKNPDNYFQTGVFLNFIQRLGDVSKSLTFSQDSSINLANVLLEAKRRREGSYLLNARAYQVLQTITGDEDLPWYRSDKLPFEISPGRYALFSAPEELSLAALDQNERIEDLLKRLNRIEDDIEQAVWKQHRATGDTSVSVDKRLWQERLAIFQDIRGCFGQPIKPEDLLPERQDRTEADKERNAKDFFDYLFLVSQPIRSFVEEPAELNVDITKISLQEQFQFLNFLKHKEVNNIQEVKGFTRTYDTEGLRTFLSLDEDRSLGDRIIRLGLSLEQPAATAIFEKYSEIVDTAQEAGSFMGGSAKLAAQVSRDLLRRGKEVLVAFIERQEKAQLAGASLPADQVLSQLGDIKSQLLLFAAAFKTLSKEAPVSLAEIKDTDVAIMPALEISPPEQQEMLDLFARTHTGHAEDLRAAEIKEFQEKLQSPKTRFYIVKHCNDILAFVRFDEMENGHLNSGSFNVDPNIQGSKIGNALLHAALERENEERDIEGAVDANDTGLIRMYTDKFGYELTGEKEDFGGNTYLKLIRPMRRQLKQAA